MNQIERINQILDNDVHKLCDYGIYSELKDLVAELTPSTESVEEAIEELLRFATHECHKLKNPTYREDMKIELREKYLNPILSHSNLNVKEATLQALKDFQKSVDLETYEWDKGDSYIQSLSHPSNKE